MELNANRQRALLSDLELELSHALSDAVQKHETCYRLLKTADLQKTGANHHVKTLQSQLKRGDVSVDFLMDAQRRFADATVSYHRACTEYELAKIEVAMRAANLLSQNEIRIESTEN